MNTVIVPLDGSAEAEAALPYARDLAGPDGRILLLTSVWHGEPVAPRRYFEDRALALAGDDAQTRVVVEVRPSQAILDVAVEMSDALICMAAHGRNALGRAVLGSTAEAVLRGTDRPVVLVGPRAAADRTRTAAHNLLLAVDEPETADVLVPYAVELADRLHLHLWSVESVQAAPYPFTADAPVPATDLEEARGLGRAVELLAERAHGTETKALYAVEPADAIVHFATDLPASWIVMGSHGRAGVARFALGSVAMRIVHRAPCPVMVVRQ
jgi:nucleotide-binding universal stress UspA family protein